MSNRDKGGRTTGNFFSAAEVHTLTPDGFRQKYMELLRSESAPFFEKFEIEGLATDLQSSPVKIGRHIYLALPIPGVIDYVGLNNDGKVVEIDGVPQRLITHKPGALFRFNMGLSIPNGMAYSRATEIAKGEIERVAAFKQNGVAVKVLGQGELIDSYPHQIIGLTNNTIFIEINAKTDRIFGRIVAATDFLEKSIIERMCKESGV